MYVLLQEYPHHVVYINDPDRLTTFLCNWEVFDALFDAEYSGKLVKLWRTVSNCLCLFLKYYLGVM